MCAYQSIRSRLAGARRRPCRGTALLDDQRCHSNRDRIVATQIHLATNLNLPIVGVGNVGHPRWGVGDMTRADAEYTSPSGTPAARVGCSGWQYKHWRGDFYPADLPVRRWLKYYAAQFDTVEVNNSFYRLPEAATFATWRDALPRGFVYAVKASRFLTHVKRLKKPEAPLQRLFGRVTHLGHALGPVLYQLPPRWPVNLNRFETSLAALPPGRAHVVEFRDASWYVPPVYEAMTHHGVAMCLHDLPGTAQPDRRNVGPFIYIRFHGPSRYQGRYAHDTLADWAHWCRAHIARGVRVYAYFNNDIGGHAPHDARRFRELLGHAIRRCNSI